MTELRPTASTITDAQLDELHDQLAAAREQRTRYHQSLQQKTAHNHDLAAECDRLAAALREVLATFRHINDNITRTTVGYVSSPIHPTDYDRWRAALNPTKEQ